MMKCTRSLTQLNHLRTTSRTVYWLGNQKENKFLSSKSVAVIGSPTCSGQSKKGTELGPEAIRKTDLFDKITEAGWHIFDDGDIDLSGAPTSSNPTVHGMKRSSECGYASQQLHKKLVPHLQAGRFVLNLGGDHSTACGSISAVLKVRPSTAVIWIDAHADINTDKTSPSGNIHGMPIAFLLGLIEPETAPGWEWMSGLPKLKPNKIVYIGLRDVDPGEKNIMLEHGIRAYSMHDIDKYNIGPVLQQALNDIDPYGTLPLHLSFDIDALDPSIAPSTGTPVLGGLTFREGAFICEILAESSRLCSMDITEVNPLLGSSPNDAIQTADMAKRMISCALGETLLWGNQAHVRKF